MTVSGARSDDAPGRRDPGKRIYAGFAIAFVAVVAAGAAAAYVANAERDQAAWVSHSFTVMQRLDGLLTQFGAAETAVTADVLAPSATRAAVGDSVAAETFTTLREVRSLVAR